MINQLDGKNCCGNPYVGNQRQTQAYRDFLDPASDQAGTAPNELWMYTSNMSHGSDAACTVPQTNDCRDYHTNSVSPLWSGWPGYVIDQPAAQARAMGWMAFGYDVTGELYWHTTWQLSKAWTSQWEQGGHGDGTLFYPGTPARIGGTHDIPVESLRLKRIRDGREDYEYLLAAKRAGHGAQAEQIFHDVFGANSMLSNVTAAIGDQAFTDARARLAALISADEPQAPRTCDDPDAIKGTPGDDPHLTGTAGDDVIVGLGGDDTIRGLGGDDLLCGGDGFDTLDGGPGDDILFGEAAEYGTATAGVTVDLGSGTAAGAGQDELHGVTEVYGSPFADRLSGSGANGATREFLAGGAGDDVLDGRGGRDWLTGGSGDDTLTGGPGPDELDGQAGADTLLARDGETDLRVDCGADSDRVAEVDAADPVTGCEAPPVTTPEPTVPEPAHPTPVPSPQPVIPVLPGPQLPPRVLVHGVRCAAVTRDRPPPRRRGRAGLHAAGDARGAPDRPAPHRSGLGARGPARRHRSDDRARHGDDRLGRSAGQAQPRRAARVQARPQPRGHGFRDRSRAGRPDGDGPAHRRITPLGRTFA